MISLNDEPDGLLHEEQQYWNYYLRLREYKQQYGCLYRTWGGTKWKGFAEDLKSIDSEMTGVKETRFIYFCYNLNLLNKAFHCYFTEYHTYCINFIRWYCFDLTNRADSPFEKIFGKDQKLSQIKYILDTPFEKKPQLAHIFLANLQGSVNSFLTLSSLVCAQGLMHLINPWELVEKILEDPEPFSENNDDLSCKFKIELENAKEASQKF